MIRDDVVKALCATGKWSEPTARLAERARYRCEYCSCDLLASLDAYKRFEVDHIVPTSKGGDPLDFDNLALACRHCNVHLKRSWDPREAVGQDATRERLIEAVKSHLLDAAERYSSDLTVVRTIVGWSPDGAA
ncbi:MAG: HNH endonuclease signature motif containing protein [Pseudomonadota bacterium]